MGRALITDLYELNMAASYLRREMTAPATFSLFVRELPPDRGFLVAAGLEDCLDYLESFAFADEDLAWMAGHGFSGEMVDALAGVRFTGDVEAVPEGRVVLAGEPLLEVTAPLPEAQLVEAYLLNQVTYQSAIATKAVRCRIAAGEIELVDFSLRRTHGTEASLAVARVSAVAGFTGTSNVEAARRLGLRAAGTMAHSYIESFPTESDAFRAFVEDLPPPYTFLVDTYDTLEGVRHAARAVGELGLPPEDGLAIRIDSGDLAGLSSAAREILDEAGLSHVRIFVSGALDEYGLHVLSSSGAPVDAAGVGTRFGVSADAPYLDSVYKLVAVDGRPVMKLSPGKESLPGPKQVWRRGLHADLLGCRGETAPDGGEPLLEPVMRSGRRAAAPARIAESRGRLERDLAWLPGEAKRIERPTRAEPVVSDELEALARATRAVHATRGARTPAAREPATGTSDHET